MLQKSRRAKASYLQNLVRDKILQSFPHLKPEDVTTALNGQIGPDIILSKVGRTLVGFNFECKNQNTVKTVYEWYKQSERHAKGKLKSAVVMKMNSRIGKMMFMNTQTIASHKN